MEAWSVLLASAKPHEHTSLTLNEIRTPRPRRRPRRLASLWRMWDKGCGIVAASDGERTPDGNPDGPPRPCPRRDGDAHGP